MEQEKLFQNNQKFKKCQILWGRDNGLYGNTEIPEKIKLLSLNPDMDEIKDKIKSLISDFESYKNI